MRTGRDAGILLRGGWSPRSHFRLGSSVRQAGDSGHTISHHGLHLLAGGGEDYRNGKSCILTPYIRIHITTSRYSQQQASYRSIAIIMLFHQLARSALYATRSTTTATSRSFSSSTVGVSPFILMIETLNGP